MHMLCSARSLLSEEHDVQQQACRTLISVRRHDWTPHLGTTVYRLRELLVLLALM